MVLQGTIPVEYVVENCRNDPMQNSQSEHSTETIETKTFNDFVSLLIAARFLSAY